MSNVPSCTTEHKRKIKGYIHLFYFFFQTYKKKQFLKLARSKHFKQSQVNGEIESLLLLLFLCIYSKLIELLYLCLSFFLIRVIGAWDGDQFMERTSVQTSTASCWCAVSDWTVALQTVSGSRLVLIRVNWNIFFLTRTI